MPVLLNCRFSAHYCARLSPYSLHCLGLIRQSTRGFKLRIGALLIACLVAASSAQPRRLVSLQ